MISQSLSQGFRQTQNLSLRQTQTRRLTMTQRLIIEQRQLDERIHLMGNLHNVEYVLEAICTNCGRRLKTLEILRGFTIDPTDLTTKCNSCGMRFLAYLKAKNSYVSIEVAFYCPTQTLDQLRDKQNLTLYQLITKYAAIYHSALIHFGTLKNAFSRIGVNYELEGRTDWKNKARHFLGKLPDTVIAECVGEKVTTIRSFRRSLNIQRCIKSDCLY